MDSEDFVPSAEWKAAQSICDDLKEGISSDHYATIKQLLLLIEKVSATKNKTNKSLLASLDKLGVDALVKSADAKLNSWKKSIDVGDYVEIYSDKELKWFASKILSRDKDKIKVHYLGWQSKYDQDLLISEKQLSPCYVYTKPLKTPKVKDIAVIPEVHVEIEGGQSTEADETAVVEEPLVTLSSGRKVKVVAKADEKPPKKQKTKEAADHNDWICGVCRLLEAVDGSDLLLCDGVCKRSFHAGCLDGRNLPSAEEDHWFCEECREGKHSCFLCSKKGEDYKTVNKCSGTNCGKFYHRHCLESTNGQFIPTEIHEVRKEVRLGPALQPVLCREAAQRGSSASSAQKKKGKKSADEADGTAEDGSASATSAAAVQEVTTFAFKCPYHFCDTCHDFYKSSSGSERTELNRCISCPKSYHTQCIPPGSRYNTMCLLCPNHPDELLPTQDVPVAKKSSSATVNSYATFFDQLAIPEVIPSAADPLANHFRLVTTLRTDLENSQEPPEFVRIRRNDYDTLSNKSLITTYNPEFCCDCVVTCGPMCLNRVSKIECCDVKVNRNNDPVCHVGAHCGNRAIQNREFAEVEVAKEFQMGFGLKALSDVPRGSLIIEYVGEVLDYETAMDRMRSQRKNTPNDKDFYIMELDSGVYVDGKFKGNNSRFINHSCGPNAELQRWITKGHMRIAIVAVRDIKSGEFFSYDYQFDTNEEDMFQCYCGAPQCRGTMAPKKKDRGQNGIPSNRSDRLRLIAAGRNREKLSVANRVEDELSRSYTGKMIPGDPLNEIKSGPVKTTFAHAQDYRILLVRNVLQGSNFEDRRSRAQSKA